MKFEPGQKVRCIDDVFAYADKIYQNKPKVGRIYTVRSICHIEYNNGHRQVITLEEIRNAMLEVEEPGFSATRFELVSMQTKTLGECWEIADLDDLAPPQAKALQFLKLARQNGHFL